MALSLHKHLRTFRRCEQGLALLEFALVLPILLLLVFGGIEITRLILFHQKLDNATSGVANVLTQLDLDEVPCAELQWQRDVLMAESMQPFDFSDGGSMVVSAIEASHPDPKNPDNSKSLRQTVIWQWKPGTSASLIGAQGGNATGSGWPESFRRAPNDGGMYAGERVIAVEAFYTYRSIVPFIPDLLGLNAENSVYKVAFFRSRFGKMGRKQGNC